MALIKDGKCFIVQDPGVSLIKHFILSLMLGKISNWQIFTGLSNIYVKALGV
jgi:hypothetical protein